VWYDVAASPLLYDSRIFRTVVDTVGEDKILYGSDYPLLLYPALQKNPDFSSYLNEINASGLNERELKKILGDNFSRLIGLS
jgi:predicted TIM-barrel fold metal-dependent hydrolase